MHFAFLSVFLKMFLAVLNVSYRSSHLYFCQRCSHLLMICLEFLTSSVNHGTLFQSIIDLLCIGACFSNASESSWLNCAETVSISFSSPGAYHMFISSASSS